MKSTVRLRLLASSMMLGAGLLSMPAAAQVEAPQLPQEGPTDAASDAPQDIVVTGSRIARTGVDTSVPTLQIGVEALEQRGFRNVADLATQLPQFAPSFGTSRTQSTFSGAASSGLNLINLRNLGGGRTLTLTNGRRMPGGTTTGTAVDFNTVPTANIERIEVVTGGASAIYGADAVAGVVNIITKTNFEGLEVGGSYGISERGDNENPSGYLMFGSKFGDGGHIMATVQADFQGEVSCATRDVCSQDFAWFPPAAAIRGPAAYSAVGVNGTFFLNAGPTGSGLGAISATRVGSSTSYTDSNGNLIPFVTSRDGFNRNGARTLAQPTKRLLFAVDASYPISDSVSVFTELNYGSSRTDADFEGHPFQSTAAGSLFGGGPGVTGLQASIPVNINQTVGGVTTSVANPIIPTAVYNAAVARGQTTINWQQRFSAFDSRGATNDRTTVRAVAGVRGDFTVMGDKNWNWEVNYVYGRTKLDSLTRGLVSTRQLYYGLRTELTANGTLQCADAGARATGCVPINPFLPYTDAQRRALSIDAGQSGESILNDAQAFVSGELFNLPGGPLAFAVGGEYRTFSGFLDYDAPINNAEVTGNQIGDVTLSKTITKEAYGELIAPVLADLPFIRRLTLEGAYRISDPSNGGNYSTWRYGGTWEPVGGLRFRVMRARAVRAPTPGELSGVGQTFGTVNDPCTVTNRSANATRAANCTADGVPATYDPPLNVQQSVAGFVGGNPNLAPERATTLTYGLAFEPSFIPGLSITVDRFEIKLTDVINTVGRQLKANQCYDTTSRLFCGDLTRSTNPNVPGANYVLTAVNDQLINVAALDIRGIDFELRYNRPLLNGRLSLQGIGTLYDKATQTALPGQPSTDLLGFAGGSTSDQGFVKFTGAANVGWQEEDGFGINYNLRYIGKARTSPFAPATYPTIGDRFYHNARIVYNVDKQYQFYFGVNNIADSKPPFFPTSTAGTQALDTIPAFYDIFGRQFFAGFKVNWR
ncbi:MAG: TonB-dependent receptor [Sphingomonas adhaesiva]|uniref:TonB-dependent receptor domain-containing protein n=1 Tax=Sphingomonas adhaesiva TaxID=28212 RepID=UPI002FF860BA